LPFIFIYPSHIDFETTLEIVKFILEIQIIEINVHTFINLSEFIDVKYQSPLIELLIQQSRSMFRFIIKWDSYDCILYRDILNPGELLFNFNQFMFSHNQHVAQVANPSWTSTGMTHFHISDWLASFLQMFH